MSVAFDLPADIELGLRSQVNDLNAEAKEAFAIDLYRRRRLTHSQLAAVLGLSRLETEAVLKNHGVYYDLTVEDVQRESEELSRLRCSPRSSLLTPHR